MPTVSVRPNLLFEHLTQRDCVESFEQLCFDFGLEFDGEERGEDGTFQYKIEVGANRPDLLCAEGIGLALAVYLQKRPFPPYKLLPPDPPHTLFVSSNTYPLRPYGFAAILRGVTLTPERYESFIALQDKIHQNLARRRTLVAVGTHDLSTIEGPFYYTNEDPSKIRFVPLNQSVEVDGHGMVELLSTHAQLKQYLPIIAGSPVFPVMRDAKGRVLSVPPVINGELTRISVNTKDILIDVTATDRTKGITALNVLCAMFAVYCEKQFTVEPVKVVYQKGHPAFNKATSSTPDPSSIQRTFINPDFSSTYFRTDLNYIKKVLGVTDLTLSQVKELMTRMMLKATAKIEDSGDESVMIDVEVPFLRSDVMHACDIAEDVAIAYNYNKIKCKEFSSVNELPARALTGIVRNLFALSGYHETLTWGLCSLKEGFTYLGHPWPPVGKVFHAREDGLKDYDITSIEAIQLLNPKTQEFEMVRVSLIPGLLKALAANLARELPIKLFEIGDAVYGDSTTETGAFLSRSAALLYANHSGSGLEFVHGMVDAVLEKLGLASIYDSLKGGKNERRMGPSLVADKLEDDEEQGDGSSSSTLSYRTYKLVERNDDPMYLPGRCVDVVVEPDSLRIGRFGVLHPEVLKNFRVTIPCSIFEFNLQPFLKWMSQTHIFME